MSSPICAAKVIAEVSAFVNCRDVFISDAVVALRSQADQTIWGKKVKKTRRKVLNFIIKLFLFEYFPSWIDD